VDQNRIKELEKKQIRFERNLAYGLGITLIALLLLLIVLMRMRSNKNRIISAQRIQQLEDEKRILAAQSVIVGQEEERKRLAQELHDGIGVLLSTASMHFSNLSLDDDPAKTKDIYSKATKMLNEASKEVRKVSHNMMPGVLSKFGLKEAIEDLFEKVEEIETIRTDVSLTCSNERLPENLEIMIYRIVQEMINNTLKHAKATQIKCYMKRDQEKITIHYSDNGKGFNVLSLPHDKSLGIYGIRSRVDFLSGSVNLKSGKDIGTTYEIEIPLVQTTNRPKNR
jgi:signal transduction histidine kinase